MSQYPANSISIKKENYLGSYSLTKIQRNLNNKNLGTFLVNKNNSKESRLIEDANQIDNFIDELYDSNTNSPLNFIKDDKNSMEELNNLLDKDLKKPRKSDNKRIKNIFEIDDLNKIETKNKNILSTPKAGEISVGKFKIPTRGYVELEGSPLSINLVRADAIETLKFIAGKANYGIVIIESDKKEDSDENISSKQNSSKITVSFKNQNISDVFNSILMASNLQAKVEKNIIFVGNDIFNKTLNPDYSKTYRLNQANAASVGDYLVTLGAKISKVLVKGSSVSGEEIGDGNLKNVELNDSFVSSYGNSGGPLVGLIGTVDLRLQTITLIGSKELISTAEKYIKSMDVRQRQVALSIKIIDVSLTKTDIANSTFEFRSGDSYFINNSGLSLITSNGVFALPADGANVQETITGGLPKNNFLSWLEAKITNENAKVMASPTLILGENSDPNLSGAAAVDDSLGAATIGRPFSNEGFIKVGETVVVQYEKTVEEGNITCVGESGTAGITFGAKVDKIDDNGYVTFALSPAISSVTRTQEIAGCGIQSILSVRKLDTGSIRVKDGDTLLLSGVLKDEDSITTSKTPLLGDIPILGRLFRKSSKLGRQSELIILVTPRIIKEDYS